MAYYPGDLIDGRFNNYILEHCYRFFSGLEKDFWQAPFMYPEKEVISYSDNLLGTSIFYAFFRVLGSDRENAFQYWYHLICLLNYAAAYLLMQHLFKHRVAAVIGALVFAFSMALQSQMGHAQTYTRFPMALAMLFALKYADGFNLKWFFLTVFALVYQMYCGIYLGFLLMFPLGILVLALVLLQFNTFKTVLRQKFYVIKALLLLLLNALLLLPLMVPYLNRAKQMGLYDYHNIAQTIPTPLSHFSSWSGTLCWDFLRETTIGYPAFWDHLIFAGGVATIGLFVFLFGIRFFYRSEKQEKNKLQWQALWLCALLTFVFFLRVNDWSAYRLLHAIPGYGSMRALQRIVNVELLFFGMGAAFVVKKLSGENMWRQASVFVLVLALFVCDNYVPGNFVHHRLKSESQARINALADKLKSVAPNAVVSYEPDTLLSRAMDYQLDAMLACQQMGFKTLNGYTATSPGGYGEYWVNPNEKSRMIWLDKNGLSANSVVVIH